MIFFVVIFKQKHWNKALLRLSFAISLFSLTERKNQQWKSQSECLSLPIMLFANFLVRPQSLRSFQTWSFHWFIRLTNTVTWMLSFWIFLLFPKIIKSFESRKGYVLQSWCYFQSVNTAESVCLLVTLHQYTSDSRKNDTWNMHSLTNVRDICTLVYKARIDRILIHLVLIVV